MIVDKHKGIRKTDKEIIGYKMLSVGRCYFNDEDKEDNGDLYTPYQHYPVELNKEYDEHQERLKEPKDFINAGILRKAIDYEEVMHDITTREHTFDIVYNSEKGTRGV